MRKYFNIPELIVLVVIFIGLILQWFKIDVSGICMNLGFGLMGVIGLIDALIGENMTFRLKGFLVALPVLMIILSAKAIIEHKSDFSAIAVVLIIHLVLLKKERTSKTAKSPNEQSSA